MNDGTVAIIVVNTATIALAPTHAAEIVVAEGQADALARATLADVCPQPASMMAPALAAGAVIEVAAIYQPPSQRLTNPRFTYDLNGRLTLIDYDGARQKSLRYANDRLVSIDVFDGRLTQHKSFTYDQAGALTQISES